jgi:flavin-dependent dehydrogenase
VSANRDFDAVIVGASVAGCTAARLYAERGARVALVEKRPDIDASKTVCTHYIQSSATPTIEKLGLARLIEERGAVRNSVDLWTPYGGWIPHRGDTPYGYNVTRRVLDPLLRRMTADTPGVELLLGATATVLIPGGSSSRTAPACAASCAGSSSSPLTGATRGSRGWRACPAACARTTASSIGRTGAA